MALFRGWGVGRLDDLVSDIIYAAHPWPDNAALIEAAAKLGYLRKEWRTLDPTYGKGNFWTRWQPANFIKTDLHPNAQGVMAMDFRKLEFVDGFFEAVVFDPPYKLNGTPTEKVDSPYGVHIPTRWQDRIDLMQRGQKECARVLKNGGFLLSKCQDQVVSGKVVWQTDIMTNQGMFDGLVKVDRLDILTNPRPQPHSRQMHARRNSSALLVFRKQ